ncbi:MAG TPA: DUF1997 domain-containing protein [Leptolyngbyaceae cyanobacterium M65_K2018_010]|nr:DUF1997 domain-containing protein [Leptolyngbyaceae cyanobacterium M65_K2018_010]
MPFLSEADRLTPADSSQGPTQDHGTKLTGDEIQPNPGESATLLFEGQYAGQMDALVVGHFSVLGYEVEPKVGLYLSPLAHQVYRIDTVPIPGYTPPGYDVDFQAVLHLLEGSQAGSTTAPLTQVDWQLSLKVKIHKPRFLNALPHSLIKGSGDRLLNQVVRQVSKRLTRRVQEDFHTSCDLPLPQSYHRHYFWSDWGKRHSHWPTKG